MNDSNDDHEDIVIARTDRLILRPFCASALYWLYLWRCMSRRRRRADKKSPPDDP